MRRSTSTCLLAALVASVAVHTAMATENVRLQNGVTVAPYPTEYPGDTYRYYGGKDTLLDPAQPTANFGRLTEHGLVGGTNRKVLIQFRELHRAVGAGKRIVAARLVLHTVPGAWSTTNQVAIYPLRADWRQGGGSDAVPTAEHWTSTWTHRLYSDDPNRALPWATPGAAAPGVDRAATASQTLSSGQYYNAPQNTWLLAGVKADVERAYANRYTDFGWVIEYTDPASATGQNLFYTCDADDPALRPELLVYYDNELAEPSRVVDLSVAYIRRTPEYHRYDPIYTYKTFHDEGVGTMDAPGFADTQKWPQNGETVTFTAYVKNMGTGANSGPFNYRWKLNGQVIGTGTEAVGIPPYNANNGDPTHNQKSYTVNWTWDADEFPADPHRNSADSRDRVLTFEADYDGQVAEYSENNNALVDYPEAPAMGYWVEASMYRYFNETRNQVGTYSFDDWLQWVIEVWNQTYLENARFAGFAEDGCLERVRIGFIGVVPDGQLCAGGNHNNNCTPNFMLDGEWGFRPDQGYVQKWSRLIEWGLLHECMHQLGMIDLYTMNMEAGTPSTPLRVQVKDGLPFYISRGYYPPFGGLMGGGDTRYSPTYEGRGLTAAWDIGALSSNAGYRRGYYGEELYDLPDTLKLRAVDASGEPIPHAELKIWQSRGGATPDEDVYAWQPIFLGEADADGVVTLPNYSTLDDGFTTYTGHTLKPNPWGRINVVGGNCSLLVRCRGWGQKDYTFMRTEQVNVVFWQAREALGYAPAELTYDLRFEISPTANLGLVNIAQGKTATASGGVASYAIDGNLNTRWQPNPVDVGAYLQVDLGATYDVANVVLVHNGGGGDFFRRFRIECSPTGAFAGEQTYFASEDVNWGLTAGTRRDIDPDNEQLQQTNYAGAPTAARYVRLTCEEAWGSNLAELRIYPALPGNDTTPPATIADLAVGDVSSAVASLHWTTPGDDGLVGVATEYDLRYATFAINAGNFASATPVTNPPQPWKLGNVETYLLKNLTTGTRYWVALKARDDVGNESGLSNVVSFVTTSNLPSVAFETLSTPVDSSFASGLTSSGARLYYLRRDTYAFYESTTGGQTWSQLFGPDMLGGWHGDWMSGLLAYHTDSGYGAGAIYSSQRDASNIQRLVFYDIAGDMWNWTPTYAFFSHSATIVGDEFFALTHAWGWNTGGSTQRVELGAFPAYPAYPDRTGLANILGESGDWFCRGAQLTHTEGRVYGIKNDWTTPNGTGDRVFGFDPADFDPSIFTGVFPDSIHDFGKWQTHGTPAVDYGQLPFEIGYGAVLVGLPADWSVDVGSQGGLFIVAGASPSNNEGWGNPSDIYAIFDVATRSLKTGVLPGISGYGASGTFHDGAVYIKRGGTPSYNTTLWRVTPTGPVACAGDVNCDGQVTFADIDPFVARLGCPATGPACDQPPACPWTNADVNGDGSVTFADIDPFVGRLGAACQ